MIHHPDFFNVRKMAIILASGPILLLLLIGAVDFSWPQFRIWQQPKHSCSVDAPGGITKLTEHECPIYRQ